MNKSMIRPTLIMLAITVAVFFLLRRPRITTDIKNIPGATYPDYRQPNNPAKYELYYQVSPGISDLQEILTGGPTYNYVDNSQISPQVTEQVINNTFNMPALNQLTNQYIPLYGFVGVVAA